MGASSTMPARGVSIDQDSRFKDKEAELLKSTKFPSIFVERVDMSRVSAQVMRPWIATRVEQMMGFEDDVLVEFVTDHLERDRVRRPIQELTQFPDPRRMQIALTGFLENKSLPFMKELWGLLLSAQDSVGGVPRAFVEQKKREMQAMRAENASVMDEVRRRHGGDAPQASASQGPRFDRGRPPVPAGAREFVDKRGNITRRERDAGWVRCVSVKR